MRSFVTSLSLVATLAVVASVGPVTAGTTAQAASCASQADHQSLTGAERQTFLAKCSKGAMVPAKPALPIRPGASAQSVVNPSGHAPVVRSQQCTAEADRRGLKDRERAAFRLSCLASAAPVKAIGASTTPTSPTPAKANLGVQTPSGPH
jgi:hypothetical protein